MGVSGAGKSTIAAALATQLGYPFLEGDQYHSPENIAKMASGKPLENSDRKLWIAALCEAANAQFSESQQPCIISCSALNTQVRAWIETGLDVPCRYVYLDGPYALIAARLSRREDHFFDASLLRSQFDALDIPDQALRVGIDRSQAEIVEDIIRALNKERE